MYEEVKVMTHSSIKISGSKVIYFDPFEIAEESPDADIIFVTHGHYDHFSPVDIAKIVKDDTILVMPDNMKDSESKVKAAEVVFVHPNEVVEIGGLMVKTTPAYNRMKPFHPRNDKNVGYIVNMDDTTYYVAGDTDAVNELRTIKCDVALVPVGGKFTMLYTDAAELVNEIDPKLAIPTHYGSIVGSPDDGKKFADLVNPGIEVRVMI